MTEHCITIGEIMDKYERVGYLGRLLVLQCRCCGEQAPFYVTESDWLNAKLDERIPLVIPLDEK